MSLEEFISQALSEFSNLPLEDPKQANDFFEKYGAGNVLSGLDQPYKRLFIYERLLNALLTHDYAKYQNVHKGTPFYIMAWLAFDIHNFEKALYYIDAAISEDVLNSRTNWINLPASNFLTLRNPDKQVAQRTISIIRSTLDTELSRFNAISGLSTLTTDLFISRFVQPLLTDPTKRTIVSVFYVFLLEHSERQQELRMRSIEGGSIAPFILHLFSGALIFESLLKNLFPTKNNGTSTQTLGDVFNTSAFQGIYPSGISTSAHSFAEIIAGITDNSLLRAFTTTTKIRNTTGHNLIWDDTLASPNQYRLLFEQEVNSILYIVSHSY
ncbi:MAG: hypothetical protein JW725_05575 [Candidatus Babeliaceae bacterium]|nr:hypothetical protein [Candidatus Babeliaceae bacterium]